MTNGRNLGKQWLMKSASSTAFPECKDGKAPNTNGDAVKFEVYMSMPNSKSMRRSPAGDPSIE